MVREKLKVLMRYGEEYDKKLYDTILDQVVDKAAIITDWDAILIDVFCKKQIFDNSEDTCKKFFDKYRDKSNRYFKMGDNLLKLGVKKLEQICQNGGESANLYKETLKDNEGSLLKKERILKAALGKDKISISKEKKCIDSNDGPSYSENLDEI